jgi:hypothetical protein
MLAEDGWKSRKVRATVQGLAVQRGAMLDRVHTRSDEVGHRGERAVHRDASAGGVHCAGEFLDRPC